jgi:hypothetical protein
VAHETVIDSTTSASIDRVEEARWKKRKRKNKCRGERGGGEKEQEERNILDSSYMFM